MKTSLLISAALFLALTAAAYAELHQAPPAPQPAPAHAVPYAAAVCCSVPAVAPVTGEPLPIREAHSDGGYWYWQP